MIQVDERLLKDMRLNKMTAGDKARFLAEFGQALENRVGDTLVRNMNPQQLQELEAHGAANNPEAAIQWLQAHFPNYQQIVLEELKLLKAEIIQNGRIINPNTSWEQTPLPQAEQQAPAAAPPAQQPPQPPQNPNPPAGSLHQ